MGSAILALAILSGCGNATGGSCGSAGACGGDITGTWAALSSCFDTTEISMAGAAMGCPGTTLSTDVLVSGTVTYNVDLTYSSSAAVAFDIIETVPASCFTQNGIRATCDQVTQVIQATSVPEDFQSVQCVGAGSGCQCTFRTPTQASSETGTYSTATGVLTLMPSGGQPRQLDYCVKGTMLTETAPPEAGTSANIVFMKQ